MATRAYAFIENVMTRVDYRGKGYASECLEFVREISEKENCYKMMLLTGSQSRRLFDFMKKPDTTAAIDSFYTVAGNGENKADGIK